MEKLIHEGVWPEEFRPTVTELKKMMAAGAAKKITIITGHTEETKNYLYLGFYRVREDGELSDLWEFVGNQGGKKRVFKNFSALRNALERLGLNEGWMYQLGFYYSPSAYCATPKIEED